MYCESICAPVLTKANIDLTIVGHDHQWRDIKAYSICRGAEYANYKKTEGAVCPHSPPYLLFIGRGLSLHKDTVIILKADKKNLTVRIQNSEGKTLASKSVRIT